MCGVWVWCGCVGGHGHGLVFVLCCVCVCVCAYICMCVLVSVLAHACVQYMFVCMHSYTVPISDCVSPLLTTVLSTSLD